ncbi:MAG: hypothetical protein H0T42_17515 [Deltaproteobacteria bacterium]|nr:hypothetical protein [Deltaproteobacteria bacterium]
MTRDIVIDEPFEGEGALCEPWGNSFANSGTTLIQAGGELEIIPRISGAGGCSTRAMFEFPRGGLIVEVPEVMRTSGAYTAITVGNDDSIQMTSEQLAYRTANGSITYSQIPYRPTQMRWWKLHDEQGVLTASYSETGLQWVVFGERPAPGPFSVQLSFFAGVFLDVPDATDSSRIGRLLVCDE